LDIYCLLNDSDPEIEDMQRRVVAMSRPPRAPDGPRSEESAERPRMDRTETPDGSAARPAAAGLATPPTPLASTPPAAPPAPPTASIPPTPPTAPAPPTPPKAGAIVDLAPPATVRSDAAPLRLMARGEGTDDEPFPDLAPEQSLRVYLASLESEQIFSFHGLPAIAPLTLHPVEAAAVPAGEPFAAEPPAAEPSAAAPLAPGLAAAPAAAATAAAEVGEPGEGHAPQATATLGELYLRQGHLVEAERIFREVVDREPDNAAARDALAQIQRRRAAGRPLDASQLLAGFTAASEPNGPPRSRKAYLLQSYLTRLRLGRRPHVS
jgi:hypothetical protein